MIFVLVFCFVYIHHELIVTNITNFIVEIDCYFNIREIRVK